ncbi:helix-turn-helix domain-containing protein [Micromonospora sp. NPDC005087]|uniref:AraC-like ligand-binding domain-containing protein n=1 Tax=Micromonospora sp. NPDC005087 TaxID=3364225 RepID=UPI00367E8BC4
MAIHLDTRDLPPEDRAAAVREAVLHATVPSGVQLEETDGFHARLGYWQLGTTSRVYAHEGSGLRLTRGPAQLRTAAPELVALAIQTAGRGHYRQDDAIRTVDVGELMLVDLTAPYDYWWSGEGGSFAVQVDHARLGLPVETIRRAARRIDRDSVTYGLLHSHLQQLRADVDAIDRLPGAAALVGNATANLVRALILAAADDPAPAGDDRLPHVRHWILQHLGEAELSPQRIAAAHGMSVRTLYHLWRDQPLTLTQWITHERLEAAGRELALPSTRSITATARRWGFTDATHFSRRFRAAYSMSARDWQRANR